MSAFLISCGVIFVAELGDKSQLMAVRKLPLQGTRTAFATVGMVAADALAILVGQQLRSRLPTRTIKIGASALFVALGLALIVDGVH